MTQNETYQDPAPPEIKRSSEYVEVTIASGQTTSGAIDLRKHAFGGFVLPTAFTGASVSFEGSHDGDTFEPLYKADNTLESVTVAQGRAYAFPSALGHFAYGKIVSASNEAADRTIGLTIKG